MNATRKRKGIAVVSEADCARIREKFDATKGQSKLVKFAADRLGLSEGELIATHVGEHEYEFKTTPLRPEWPELFSALTPCGPLLALTRNETTVHEKMDVYRTVDVTGSDMWVTGDGALQLQLSLQNLHAAFFVHEPSMGGKPEMESLQFFGPAGRAVHKIYLRESSSAEAFHKVVQQFAAPALEYVFDSQGALQEEQPPEQIDVEAVRTAWLRLGSERGALAWELGQNLRASRQQVLQLMRQRYAWRLAPQAISQLLAAAAYDSGGVPLAISVANRGCRQTFRGRVNRIESLEMAGGRWINVLDRAFNLHLRTDLAAHVWRVEYPTMDGCITAVEAWDTNDELMVEITGLRHPGEPESMQWRNITARLPSLD